jgi:hypothetical protein
MNRAVLVLLALAVVGGVGVVAYLMFEESGGKGPQPVLEQPQAQKPPAPAPKAGPGPAPIAPRPQDPAPIKTTAFSETAGAHHDAGLGGIVVAADGSPLEGASCELFEDTSALKDRTQEGERRDGQVTKSDGLFLFERHSLSLAERYVLKVSHPLFVTERKALDVKKPDSAIIQVTLRPGTVVSGNVRSVSGEPLARATVTVYDMSQNTLDPNGSVETSTLTDATGAYVVPNVGPGMKKVLASAPRHATSGKQGLNVEAGRSLDGIDFALNEGGSISGQAVAADGVPVASAFVTARPVRIGPRAQVGASQELDRLQAQRESEVEDRAAMLEKRRAEHDASEAERDQITKREMQERERQGGGVPRPDRPPQKVEKMAQLEAQKNAPLTPAPPGFEHIKRPPLPPQALLTNLTTRTRADGTFSIDGVEVGSYVVSVNASGFAPSQQQTIESPAQGVNFILQANARILGRVVDDETGKPIAMFSIGTTMSPEDVLIPAYSKKWFGPPKSVDGAFEYIDVRPGRIWLVADAPGYAGGRSGEIVIAQGERREGVEIRLVRGATIVGRVLSADGSPVARAIVQPEPAAQGGQAANPFLVMLTASMRRDVPEVKTDAQGRFALPNMLSGSYMLNVRHPEFGPLTTQAFTVPASGEMAVADVILARGATIRGRVRLTDGTPDTKAMVQVSPVGGTGLGAHRQAYTDSEGYFEVSGLAPGQYRVIVAQRNGQPDLSGLFGSIAKGPTQNTYSVAEGETKEIDL